MGCHLAEKPHGFPMGGEGKQSDRTGGPELQLLRPLERWSVQWNYFTGPRYNITDAGMDWLFLYFFKCFQLFNGMNLVLVNNSTGLDMWLSILLMGCYIKDTVLQVNYLLLFFFFPRRWTVVQCRQWASGETRRGLCRAHGALHTSGSRTDLQLSTRGGIPGHVVPTEHQEWGGGFLPYDWWLFLAG